MASCVILCGLAFLFGVAVALERPCPRLSPGTNVIVDGSLHVMHEHTGGLPDLPDGTPMMTYGHKSECSGFDGTIVVGGPISMSASDAYYGYSTMMRKSVQIFLDWVNDERGGLVVNGSRYAMRFNWVDDASSKQQVTNATAHAIRDTNADFAMAGYSSGLTKYAAQQSFVDGRLIVAAGAASTTVYTKNSLTFGTLGPASSYLSSSLVAIREAAASVDREDPSDTMPGSASWAKSRCGEAGCLASLQVGFIQADALFTRSVCETLPSQALELGYAFRNFASEVPATVTVPKRPSVEEVMTALEVFKAEGVTVIVGCTYYDTGIAIIEALERMDYAPLAVVLTSTIGMPAYSARLAEGWWQGEYWLGVTPWHPSGPLRGEFSGLTSSEFAARYRKRYGSEVAYQGASQFAACCVLSAAIEAAGSLNTDAVAKAMRQLRLKEFFADIAFDSHGQNNAMEHLVVQYSPGSTADHIGYSARQAAAVTLDFPTPSWAQRRCRAMGRVKGLADSSQPGSEAPATECSGNGFCNTEGICVCEGSWAGQMCNHHKTTEETGLATWAVVLIVCGCLTLASCALLCLRWYKNRHINMQGKVIKDIQHELKHLKESVVGMRSVVRDYFPAGGGTDVALSFSSEDSVDAAAGLLTPRERTTWYWEEDQARLASHNHQLVLAPHWVQYAGCVCGELEAVYQQWQAGNAGAEHLTDLVDRISSTGTEKKAFANESGTKYMIHFEKMKQINVATGFERSILRHVTQLPMAPTHSWPARLPGTPRALRNPMDAVSSETPQDLQGEILLQLHVGSIVQLAKQRSDGWAFGNVVYNVDGVEGGSAPMPECISYDAGWFPIACTAMPTQEAFRKLNEHMGGGGANCLEPPPTWSPLKDPLVAELVALADGPEKNTVVDTFLRSLKPNIKVLKVERVQNISLWQSFAVKRQTMLSREASHCASVGIKEALRRVERAWLFHGTDAETVHKIKQQGFNRSFCGKNATMFGKGVYFARDASYSSSTTYSAPDANGTQHVFLCRVNVGEYCTGVKDALAPPVRDGSRHMLFDSTVDNIQDPSIYVTYHDAQAYPEYLVHFAQ